MKIWRLVSGILSIVMFVVISFQSCAVGVVNAVENNEKDTSGAAGLFVAFLLLVAGILSTVIWKKDSKGGNIALIVLFGLAALFGFANLGTFGDLVIWSSWALICAVLAAISLIKHKKEETMPISHHKYCPKCGAEVNPTSKFCPKCGGSL